MCRCRPGKSANVGGLQDMLIDFEELRRHGSRLELVEVDLLVVFQWDED